MSNATAFDADRRVFDELRAEFPSLSFEVRAEPREGLTVDITVPQQSGLCCEVALNLCGDELGLGVGCFWSTWFPSSSLAVVQRYRAAVVGVISGHHRVVEYRRWGKCIGADLEAPVEAGWKKIYACRRGFAITWGAARSVVQNQGPSNKALHLTGASQTA